MVKRSQSRLRSLGALVAFPRRNSDISADAKRTQPARPDYQVAIACRVHASNWVLFCFKGPIKEPGPTKDLRFPALLAWIVSIGNGSHVYKAPFAALQISLETRIADRGMKSYFSRPESLPELRRPSTRGAWAGGIRLICSPGASAVLLLVGHFGWKVTVVLGWIALSAPSSLAQDICGSRFRLDQLLTCARKRQKL